MLLLPMLAIPLVLLLPLLAMPLPLLLPPLMPGRGSAASFRALVGCCLDAPVSSGGGFDDPRSVLLSR